MCVAKLDPVFAKEEGERLRKVHVLSTRFRRVQLHRPKDGRGGDQALPGGGPPQGRRPACRGAGGRHARLKSYCSSVHRLSTQTLEQQLKLDTIRAYDRPSAGHPAHPLPSRPIPSLHRNMALGECVERREGAQKPLLKTSCACACAASKLTSEPKIRDELTPKEPLPIRLARVACFVSFRFRAAAPTSRPTKP